MVQTLGMSWLICMISHVIIPTFIAFPIFNRIFEGNHGHDGFLLEMLVFTCLVVPVSLIVTFIHTKITNKKHCCEHGECKLACEDCPHKEDAIKYVNNLKNK